MGKNEFSKVNKINWDTPKAHIMEKTFCNCVGEGALDVEEQC
jgi:hypothetical protein